MNRPAELFSPFTLRDLTLRNRIVVSPMCQYSSQDGFANDWHLVHIGSRAIGGAGLVFMEASAVSPEGRITPFDLGIYDDAHIAKLSEIVRFVHGHESLIGMQLAHAGRKASMSRPWSKERLVLQEEGGWTNVVAPSAIPFSSAFPQPHALDLEGIAKVKQDFLDAARRTLEAGFDVLEIHAAHGYLLHEFLSPLSNTRTDRYGGSFENRIRLLVETATSLRDAWHGPLFVRISATDWAEGGWDIDQSVQLSKVLKSVGVDLMDVSSGALVPGVTMPIGPGYQTAFAERIKREAGIPTGAVGMITEPAQADHILRTGQADLVLLAREFLRDPYWGIHAAAALKKDARWPSQYLRAVN